MFTHQRAILLQASACKKPGQEELGNLLQPLHLDIEAINKTKEIYRKDREWQNHLTFVAEGAPTVGWVMVVRTPPVLLPDRNSQRELSVAETWTSHQGDDGLCGLLRQPCAERVQGQVCTIRLKHHPPQLNGVRDSKHAEWVKGYKALSEALRKYVMNYHTTGMSWNDKVRRRPLSCDSFHFG
jgi:adenylyl cyclase-associated protein